MKSRSSLALAGALALGCVVVLAWWLARERETPTTPGVAEYEGAAAVADHGSALSAPTSAEPSALPAGVEREAPVPASRLRARVEHRVTRAPLPGFDAELVGDGIVLGQDTSDARGRLFLPLPPEGGATVRVQSPDGWSVLAPQRSVRADATDELVFLAGPAGSERFRARLVDAASGEPLNDYMLRLGTRDGRREQLVSDRAGLVASAVDYPEGTLLVFCYDEYGPELGGELRKPLHYLELDHTIEKALAGPHELRLDVGPTYRLRLAGPAPAIEAPATAALRVVFGRRQLLPTPGNVLVRPGDPPWTRFPASYRHWGTTTPMELAVATRDGRWFGSARVPSTMGTHDLELELLPHGVLVVRVSDPEGNGVPGALVTLHPDVRGAPVAERGREKSAGNGLVEFRLVTPGRYQVGVLANGFTRRFVPLEVTGEQREDLVVELARARADRSISGRIVAEPMEDDAVTLLLTGIRPAGGDLRALEIQLERKGTGLVGNFEFTDLPEGDYELSGYCSGDHVVLPQSLALRAGEQDLVLRVARAAEPEQLELVALDREQRKPRGPILYWFEHDPPVSGWVAMLDEGERIDLPADWHADQRIGLLVSGFRVVRTPLSRARRDGDHLVLEVELERGWSGDLIAVGPGLAPLAGVRVRLDGESAGTTDANGHVTLARDEPPEQIELDYGGWRIEPSEWDDLRQLLARQAGTVLLHFSPP